MSTETTELQAEYSKGFDAGFKEGRKKYPVSSTPTDDIEAIKNALHRASARIGCPPGDNADADLYRELSHAAELVSRLSAHPKEVAPTVDEAALRGDRPPTISRNRHPRAIH
jgi:hypothetical protein